VNAADPALERALAATTADEILVCLLDAWRACRAPEIADLVDAASARARRERPARSLALTRSARDDQWDQVAKTGDPVELPWLLENFLVAGSASGWVNTDATPRLEMIATRADDPRVVPALVACCGDATLSWERSRWTIVFELIARTSDPRVATSVERLLADRRSVAETSPELAWRMRSLAAVLPALLRSAPPGLPAPDPDLLSRLAAKLELDRTTSSTVAVFLREVYAAPDDDGPRTVYADWLIERGDPRGELISLQLGRARGQTTSAGKLRERTLLAKYARAWIGEIEPAVAKTRFAFERGFLWRCGGQWQTLAARPELMTHPAWATVREYTLASGAERACDAWLDHMIALGAKRM
jgi:uncharacterized protein (TIGR02996 family)